MKTKRTILLLITVAAVACSQEKQLATDGHNIGFELLLTRGAGIGNAKSVADAGGFNVWGYSYYTTLGNWVTTTSSGRSALFRNDVVTGSPDGLTWSYGTPVEWPAGKMVTFFAYGPLNSANVTGYDDDVPVITFAVDTNPNSQTDLLIAAPMYDRTGPSPVALSFDHALSQIKFSALKAQEVVAEVKITGIELKNIYYKGTTPLDIIGWTPETGVRNFALSTASGTLQNITLTKNDQLLSTASGTMFLMPQTLNRVTNKPELSVTFTVDGQPLRWTGAVPPPSVWLPGRSYIYQLCIDGESVQVIVIDSNVSLQPWETTKVFQTVPLSTNPTKNLNAINTAMEAFNTLKGDGNHDGAKTFVLHAAGNLSHNLAINLTSVAMGNWVAGDTVMLDFNSNLDNWDAGALVSVTAPGWTISPASLSNRGTITLVKL